MDLFQIQSNILAELRQKKTQNGVYWVLAKHLHKLLELTDSKVFEVLEREHIMRLEAEVNNLDSQEQIIKNPSIITFDDQLKAKFEQNDCFIKDGIEYYRLDAPITIEDNYIAVLSLIRDQPFKSKEILLVKSLLDTSAYIIERNNERLNMMETQHRLESIISENSASLDMALEKLTDQFAELKLYKDKSDVLLRETYHRVNNNLQIILSIIRLYASHDSIHNDTLVEIGNRVRLMSAVHVNIMNALTNEKLQFSNFFNDIIKQLSYFFNGISCEVDNNTSNFGLSFDRSLPLGLLLFELFNLLKLNHPKKTIHFNCRVSEGTAPNELLLELSSNINYRIDLKNDNSIHHTLVEALIEQLDGKVLPTKGLNDHIRFQFHI